MIKYKQQEPGRNEYIELNVANFPYSFPDLVEEERFQEQMKLNNGAFAYFKIRMTPSEEMNLLHLYGKRKDLNISCCIVMHKRMIKM